MDEYIRTLEIQVARGDAGAKEELEKALEVRAKRTASTQRFASNLRASGNDVTYRKDGGIEFRL